MQTSGKMDGEDSDYAPSDKDSEEEDNFRAEVERTPSNRRKSATSGVSKGTV